MRSGTQAIQDEVVSMPFIFGPARSHDIWSRELGHLRSHKLPVNKQLHFNTTPRISIVHGPTRNTLRFDNNFTPTMERRRKRSRVDHDRKRAHEKRVEYRLRN